MTTSRLSITVSTIKQYITVLRKMFWKVAGKALQETFRGGMQTAASSEDINIIRDRDCEGRAAVTQQPFD